MKKLLLFVFLFFLSVGCVGNTRFEYTHVPGPSQVAYKHIPVYVDIKFGEGDKVGIQNAIDAWNYVLNGYIKLDVVSYKFDMEPSDILDVYQKHGVMILKINSDASFLPASKFPGTEVAATTDSLGGYTLYLCRDLLSEDTIKPVTMHELGHILGAPDMEGPILMNPRFSAKYEACIDKTTVEVVARYQNLDPNKLNYCVYTTL